MQESESESLDSTVKITVGRETSACGGGGGGQYSAGSGTTYCGDVWGDGVAIIGSSGDSSGAYLSISVKAWIYSIVTYRKEWSILWSRTRRTKYLWLSRVCQYFSLNYHSTYIPDGGTPVVVEWPQEWGTLNAKMVEPPDETRP